MLPGFEPDSKIRMLAQMKDSAEIIIAINANDIEKNKVRGDLGITYDSDVLRLIDAFRSKELYVGSVVVTQYSGQPAADSCLPPAAGAAGGAGLPPLLHRRATPTTSPTSSARRGTVRMNMWRPPAPWWWSPHPAPAAAKWPPA